jgi:Tfp pilus assembly major pilin PilA
MKPPQLLIVAGMALLAWILIFANIEAHNNQLARNAAAQSGADEARATAQGKQAAWQAHRKRLAWDKAHPAEIARRKALALERQRQQEAAQDAERRKVQEQQRIADAQEAQRQAQEAKEAHPCDTAFDIERTAADAIRANEYQKTYDLTISGLHYAGECDDNNSQVVLNGYLLSFKALAEHNLSSGDSATDMNQAETLLAECQSLPGIYGTHEGAQCESQEEADISTKQYWEMQQYENN